MNVENLKEDSKNELEVISEEIAKNNKVHDSIIKGLNQISLEQQRYHQAVKLEFQIFNLENRLEDKASNNQKLGTQVEAINEEINRYKNSIHRETRQQQHYLNEYTKIMNSNSWKIMAPFRSIGTFLRKVRRKIRS